MDQGAAGIDGGDDGPPVDVRRSRARRRTVSAYRDDDGTVVVLVPARLSRAEEQEWVTTMVARVLKAEERRRPSDEALARRARALSKKYLEGLARPDSVRWVDNQMHRWGSCTPSDRTIRLSDRLQGMPSWVIDYVLLHELAHLLENGHSKAFWRMVDRYPKSERAKGFLEGVALGARLDVPADEIPGTVDGSEHAETTTAEIDQLA